MSVLDVSRLYSDGEVLTEAQLDQIITDLESFFNTTKVSDDNIQNSGLTGSSVLMDGSVSTAKIAANAITESKLVSSSVTTAKLANEAVTAAKVANNAVTAAKLNSLFLPTEEGSIRLFHTFNSTLELPRGWMKCNGDIVNETNYNAVHGSGAYTTDGIASSNLLTKNLPDFTNIFAVGSDATSQDGSSAITTVGNGEHKNSWSHGHTVSSHSHNPLVYGNRATGTQNVFANIQSASYSVTSVGTSGQSFQPEAIDFIYIMRVI